MTNEQYLWLAYGLSICLLWGYALKLLMTTRRLKQHEQKSSANSTKLITNSGILEHLKDEVS